MKDDLAVWIEPSAPSWAADVGYVGGGDEGDRYFDRLRRLR
jgi:hypothetical protein